jgi:ubiquinone/menaquinone biosynthesis C-methylase UbiE
MGFHTFDSSRADKLEDAARRYRYCSAEELRWALAPEPTDTVADLGSGTGFYTDDVAPFVERVYAVDIQPEMHDYYREKGVPENVDLVTSGVDDLPLPDASLDGVFSTHTYHEFATDDALAELARVVAPGGRVAIVDWSGDGRGEAGPPLDERFTAPDAREAFETAGFSVEHAFVRSETFLLVANRE